MRAMNDAVKTHIDLGVPFLRHGFHKTVRFHVAGVIDQNIKPPKIVNDLFRHGANGLIVRDIRSVGLGSTASAFDLRYQAVGFGFRTAIIDSKCSALVNQGQANLSAHVPRTARYQGHLAC